MNALPKQPMTPGRPGNGRVPLPARLWDAGQALAGRPMALPAALLAVALLWSFWPTLGFLAERGSSDPQYSHGFLVPIFAAVVLARRPKPWPMGKPEPLGLLALALALAPRRYTGRLDMGGLDAMCMLAALAGTVLLVGGRDVLRWSWPGILFLGFMIPLPYGLEQSVALPLRRSATVAATYVLQTLGYPALAEGNIIRIGALRLGVIDACSGLGMLMTFFALATLLALTLPGPRLDRCLLIVSAAPIAVFANVLRVTLTAVAYAGFGATNFQAVHDVLGWLMMPLALILLWLEFQYLRRLLIPVSDEPLTVSLTPWVDRGRPGGAAAGWS